jgi:hypothetical protein
MERDVTMPADVSLLSASIRLDKVALRRLGGSFLSFDQGD